MQQLFSSVVHIEEIEIACSTLFHAMMVLELVRVGSLDFADGFFGMISTASFAVLHLEDMRALYVAAY